MQTNSSFTRWTKEQWVGNGLKQTLDLFKIPFAGDALKAGFDFLGAIKKSRGYQSACRFVQLLATDPQGWMVAEATARAMVLLLEEELQQLRAPPQVQILSCSRRKSILLS